MALRDRIAYLRTEHVKLLELAENVAAVLALASSTNFPEQQKSLAGLRAFKHAFDGVAEHCHAEKRIIESIYQRYLKEQEHAQVRAEHEEILRALEQFREELRFATADRTASLVGPGIELVRLLRTHVAHEDEWLDRIAKARTSGKRLRTRKRARTAPGKKRQTHRGNSKVRREDPRVPYTMEPHPEL
jgi:hypothetical protein